MAYERLSLNDESMFASYAEHIQRYEFALQYCTGKRVLDAGCGTGYGSHFLALNGAASVLGVDISKDALNEADQSYRHPNLRYELQNVEKLGACAQLIGQFDVIVNFENLEHLTNPSNLIAGAADVLSPHGGTLITSTPNGAISERDSSGKLLNEYHVKEFTVEELKSLITPYFRSMLVFGQWATHSGRLRKLRAKELFEQLCEAYYNPFSRISRSIKRAAGRSVAPPPRLTVGQDHYPGDHVIRVLEPAIFPWPPEVLIGLCRLRHD